MCFQHIWRSSICLCQLGAKDSRLFKVKVFKSLFSYRSFQCEGTTFLGSYIKDFQTKICLHKKCQSSGITNAINMRAIWEQMTHRVQNMQTNM